MTLVESTEGLVAQTARVVGEIKRFATLNGETGLLAEVQTISHAVTTLVQNHKIVSYVDRKGCNLDTGAKLIGITRAALHARMRTIGTQTDEYRAATTADAVLDTNALIAQKLDALRKIVEEWNIPVENPWPVLHPAAPKKLFRLPKFDERKS